MMNSSRSDWLVPAALIALSLVPALAGMRGTSRIGTGHMLFRDAEREM